MMKKNFEIFEIENVEESDGSLGIEPVDNDQDKCKLLKLVPNKKQASLRKFKMVKKATK